ncbi:CLDN [Mytilus edulis]|uniref:CLDN n=1 Tax=Mytilus edulis TaxID=6550 RepID=A0A8S3RQE4_MYTED|nr:CLDN [Mytilus edulis]
MNTSRNLQYVADQWLSGETGYQGLWNFCYKNGTSSCCGNLDDVVGYKDFIGATRAFLIIESIIFLAIFYTIYRTVYENDPVYPVATILTIAIVHIKMSTTSTTSFCGNILKTFIRNVSNLDVGRSIHIILQLISFFILIGCLLADQWLSGYTGHQGLWKYCYKNGTSLCCGNLDAVLGYKVFIGATRVF